MTKGHVNKNVYLNKQNTILQKFSFLNIQAPQFYIYVTIELLYAFGTILNNSVHFNKIYMYIYITKRMKICMAT